MGTQNYQGAPNADNVEVLEVGFDLWWKIYNGTGSALTNGVVYVITTSVDATDTSNPVFRLTVAAPAQAVADQVWVCVVDNSPLGKTTIANGEYGFVKIRGYCQALCNGNSDIAAGDQLLVAAAADNFIKAAAAGIIGPTTSAIALEAYTTDADVVKKVMLLGRQSSIA